MLPFKVYLTGRKRKYIILFVFMFSLSLCILQMNAYCLNSTSSSSPRLTPSNLFHQLTNALITKADNFAQFTNIMNGPLRNILYVKTQKTGSTTWKSVLQLYSEKYNLSLCMNSADAYHTNWPNQMDISKLVKDFDKKCDMIADEMIYNKDIISKAMNPNPFFLTSVRHPVQHFLSLYKFAHVEKVIRLLTDIPNLAYWKGIELFLKHPNLMRNFWATLHSPSTPVALLQKNLQLFSFGLDNTNVNLDEVKNIAMTIDHFIIAEYPIESLVLLHKKLNCSMHDLFFIRQNGGRSQSERNETVPKHIENAILKFNNGDLIFYELARKRMMEETLKYKNFADDVKRFEEGLEMYTDYCHGNKSITFPYRVECLQNGVTFGETQKKLKSQLRINLKNKMRKILAKSFNQTLST